MWKKTNFAISCSAIFNEVGKYYFTIDKVSYSDRIIYVFKPYFKIVNIEPKIVTYGDQNVEFELTFEGEEDTSQNMSFYLKDEEDNYYITYLYCSTSINLKKIVELI